MTRSRERWVLRTALAILVGTLAVLAAGCGGGSEKKAATTGAPKSLLPSKIGPGEGRLDLIAWVGYVEDGSTDPKYDWVTPFEKQTGCQVHRKVGNTSDEMVTLMRTGNYDGVSASGDATLRLIAGKDVDPVNTDLVPNYKDIFPALKNRPFNSVNGQMYGIPHGRGANLLMWRTDKVKGNLNSWKAVFEKNPPYKGKVTAYDNAIYIADAGLYLMRHRPELGIKDPYELDDKQFKAAIDLLKQQRKNVGEYWSDYAKSQASFAAGNSEVGTTWQVIANLLTADKVPVKAVLPTEGSTAWSDTWMISSTAKHPNCMYKWLNYVISPKVNAEIAEYFGEAPGNAKACQKTVDPNHCKIYHANDEAFFRKVFFWTTPRKDCGDGRGAVCKDYSEWVQGWTEVKG
jgi:putative spermidine/putrescine transport system substrate-binding protein